MRAPRLACLLSILCGAGCANVPPPASQVPNVGAAIDRLRATIACGQGLQANAKLDQFGIHGRIRVDLMMFAATPARIRMDIVSPFGVNVATLTSDGSRFTLYDMREKRFFVGPADACNIARMTTVPIPPHVLVDLLRGGPPVLKHDPLAASIAWSTKGYYVLTIPSTRTASEELHIAPNEDDRGKPWSEQRMRLLEVTVHQYGDVLYHAELDGHEAAAMAKERVDPDGIDPPLPPSGPLCQAELPRRIRMKVPDIHQDVLIHYGQVTWNPPLPEGTFTQPAPPGIPVVPVECQ